MKIVGVSFADSNKIYYFGALEFELNNKDYIIVETERGVQIALVSTKIIDIEENKLKFKIKPVIRMATEEDIRTMEENIIEAKHALIEATNIAKELNLDMKFLNASFTFNRSQLLFTFLADERVDFRELAKKLSKKYRTRIELKQIGVRDKAKDIGGLGQCGRKLCCSSFLNDLNSVSINMAKNQNLSLNPQKINGVCGRLMCCLNYENDMYEALKKEFPSIGTLMSTTKGKGKVVDVNIITGTYTIETLEKEQIKIEVNDDSSK